MIAVPLETKREDAAAWAKEFQVEFPVVFDPEGTIATAYGVSAIPKNVVIGRDGRIIQILVGLDPDALHAAAKRLAEQK